VRTVVDQVANSVLQLEFLERAEPVHPVQDGTAVVVDYQWVSLDSLPAHFRDELLGLQGYGLLVREKCGYRSKTNLRTLHLGRQGLRLLDFLCCLFRIRIFPQ
jgi:hypothetical protein